MTCGLTDSIAVLVMCRIYGVLPLVRQMSHLDVGRLCVNVAQGAVRDETLRLFNQDDLAQAFARFNTKSAI